MNINLHFSLDQCSMLPLPKPNVVKTEWGVGGISFMLISTFLNG